MASASVETVIIMGNCQPGEEGAVIRNQIKQKELNKAPVRLPGRRSLVSYDL